MTIHGMGARGMGARFDFTCQAFGLLQVDLVNWNQDERFGAYGGAHAMVLGGYGQLTDAMASHILNLRYSSPVASIVCSSTGATVTTRGGTEHKADIVIVSVPVGVLKAGSIQFSPALPTWKQQALSQIGMGKLNKVRLLRLYPLNRVSEISASWIHMISVGLVADMSLTLLSKQMLMRKPRQRWRVAVSGCMPLSAYSCGAAGGIAMLLAHLQLRAMQPFTL